MNHYYKLSDGYILEMSRDKDYKEYINKNRLFVFSYTNEVDKIKDAVKEIIKDVEPKLDERAFAQRYMEIVVPEDVKNTYDNLIGYVKRHRVPYGMSNTILPSGTPAIVFCYDMEYRPEESHSKYPVDSLDISLEGANRTHRHKIVTGKNGRTYKVRKSDKEFNYERNRNPHTVYMGKVIPRLQADARKYGALLTKDIYRVALYRPNGEFYKKDEPYLMNYQSALNLAARTYGQITKDLSEHQDILSCIRENAADLNIPSQMAEVIYNDPATRNKEVLKAKEAEKLAQEREKLAQERAKEEEMKSCSPAPKKSLMGVKKAVEDVKNKAEEKKSFDLKSIFEKMKKGGRE